MRGLCRDCNHCKPERKNEQGKVRCVKLHKFVDLDGFCDEFCYSAEESELLQLKLNYARSLTNDLAVIQHLRSGKIQ
jgi:hypothetical protein